MSETSGWVDLVELTAAQSSANTQLLVYDGDEAGDPKEKYMTRAEARKMILQAMQYFASLTPGADKLPYFSGDASAALATFTAAGRDLVDDTDTEAMRETLGLIIGTDVAAASHAHDASEVTSGVFDVARIPLVATGVQVVSSGAIADLTTPEQDEIVKGALVTTTDGRRWYYKGTGSKTSEASYIESADVTPDWSTIANKPANVTAIAGLTSAADKVPYFTGSGSASLFTISALMRSKLNYGALWEFRSNIGVALVGKGDLIVGGANAFSDTQALAVGANGKVLKANSATTTGLEWADDIAGMVVGATTAVLKATGSDVTGTLGDGSKPFATAQAAWAAGAKHLILFPKSTSYGDINTSGAALNLTVYSHYDESFGPNKLGDITTGGGALSMNCPTGPYSCSVGIVSTIGSGLAGGALTAIGFRHRSYVYSTGDSTDGTNGGPLTLKNFIADQSISSQGGQSATPGGNGGAAGDMSLEDGEATTGIYANASGGSGVTGSAGDAENPGGNGGNGGSAGAITSKRLRGPFYLVASGGGSGGGGADGGAGPGSDGSQGAAGSVVDEYSHVDAIDVSSTSTGGSIEMNFTKVDTTLAAYGGTVTGRLSDYPTPTDAALHNIIGSIVAGVFAAS